MYSTTNVNQRHAGRPERIRKVAALGLTLGVLLLASGCVGTDITPSTFSPGSPDAERIQFLWWLLLGIGSVVYVLVMGFLAYALFRRRSDAPDEGAGLVGGGTRIILIAGAAIPLVILVIVYGFSLSTMAAINADENDDPLVIDVIGNQWWWEVVYPQYDFVTANEIHIPAGEPVQLRLTSADVIHSFWVPELHGKRDLIPGRVNEFWIEANEPGVYKGLCAEFCGVQHAKMLYVVVAEPADELALWLEEQQAPYTLPDEPPVQEGYEIFLDRGCAECHRIEGTEAGGDLGPDLTHFASRLELGAGIAPNRRGYLAGWVVDPHGLKPGNLMPASQLSGPELQAMLAFLESLE